MWRDPQTLSPRQQALADPWDAHTRAEFEEHNLEATLATMTADPSVNHVPSWGVEAAQKVVDNSRPSNDLIRRAEES